MEAAVMSHDVEAFRTRYRAGISPFYNPWLHALFVLAYGLACLVFFASTLELVRPLEWLTVPLALVFYNWGEYQVHRNFGHRKKRLGALFYKRHTGDHHSFFVAGRMPYETSRDWRVILFPAWLIVLYSLVLFAVWWPLAQLNGNVAGLFALTLLGGYLSYEIFHACEHLPASHPLTRLPWIRQMRRLHELHHRRDLMQTHNFNLVLPLSDWLYGTLHWEPPQEQRRQEERPMTLMRHTVEIAGQPEQVLAYAASATRWPEWHPSSLRVDGPAGPLPTGSHFEEDIHAGGRDGHLSWDVDEYVPGRLWRAHARGDNGLSLLRLTYECQPCTGGTRFVRTLEYSFDSWLMRLANALLLRRRIDRESAESLSILKEVAERSLPRQDAA